MFLEKVVVVVVIVTSLRHLDNSLDLLVHVLRESFIRNESAADAAFAVCEVLGRLVGVCKVVVKWVGVFESMERRLARCFKGLVVGLCSVVFEDATGGGGVGIGVGSLETSSALGRLA